MPLGLLRQFLPELIDLVWRRVINPGLVYDLVLPLDQVAELPSLKTKLTPYCVLRLCRIHYLGPTGGR